MSSIGLIFADTSIDMACRSFKGTLPPLRREDPGHSDHLGSRRGRPVPTLPGSALRCTPVAICVAWFRASDDVTDGKGDQDSHGPVSRLGGAVVGTTPVVLREPCIWTTAQTR
jgi:hypothetical protein